MSDAERALTAINGRESHPRSGVGTPTGRRVELIPASAIRSERVRWLWAGRFPLRSLCVVAGEKGLGKSLLTNARVPAEATRGLLPGELQGVPIDVVVCTAEDDWRSVVKPRLVAHGADLERVHRLEVTDEAGESLLTLPDDVLTLEAQIERLRARGRTVGMLVVDPIGAFLSAATDTHRDASVRRALAPLAALADRLDLVVLVVAHLTKDESSKLINRVSGAGAFVNAARSMLVLASSPDDPDGDQGSERVLVHVRGNWGKLAPTRAARVESREVALDDGSTASVGYLALLGESTVSVDDLQRGRDENGGSDIEEAIGVALIDGQRPSSEVKAQVVAEVGCVKRTVERAAQRMAEAGELLIEPGGYPRRTTWTLSRPDASHDKYAAPVATSTNTRNVVTDGYAVATEDSAFSDDSGDSPHERVATGRDDGWTDDELQALVDEERP